MAAINQRGLRRAKSASDSSMKQGLLEHKGKEKHILLKATALGSLA